MKRLTDARIAELRQTYGNKSDVGLALAELVEWRLAVNDILDREAEKYEREKAATE